MSSPIFKLDGFSLMNHVPEHGNLKHPFSHIRVLLLENISATAREILQTQGFQVKEFARALEGDELKAEIADVHLVGIRSKTHLTADVIAAAKKLICIGAFCIGTNQIDLVAAQKRGIPVFNSPFQNSRSVAELIISNVIALARQLGDRNMEMHKGTWKKSSKNCYEVRGKILGIVGYGHVGSQLAVLSEALGMNVQYYDTQMVMPLGNSTKLNTLEELLRKADFVTLHVPLTPQTKNMIGAKEIALMKKGAYLLNASRGTVVDIPAAAAALKSGHLGGAYFDVYPDEPAENGPGFVSALQGCPNTLLSPHIGGSTDEAQIAIADEVSTRFLAYISSGHTTGAVNFPEVALPYGGTQSHRILNIHENKPGVLKAINNILSVYNVASQVLRTMDHVGYLVADVENDASSEIKEQIDALPTTIMTRLLY